VRYDPTKSGELNEDTLWHGFERIGSELSLSPSHVDRYYRAAGIVLDRALPVASVEAQKVRKTAAELRYAGGKSQMEAIARFGIKRPLRYLLFPHVEVVGGGVALSPEWFGKTGPEHSGLYRVRFQASGIRPVDGQIAHLKIGRVHNRNVEAIVEFDISAPEDHPEVYEGEVFIDMPTSLNFKVVATDEIDRRSGNGFAYALGTVPAYIFTHTSENLLLNPSAPQVFDDKGNGLFSTVLLDWIEWEGRRIRLPIRRKTRRTRCPSYWRVKWTGCSRTGRATASSMTLRGSGCNCTASACLHRTRESTPLTIRGWRRACAPSPSSISARCS